MKLKRLLQVSRATVVSYKASSDCGFVLALARSGSDYYPRFWVQVGASWKSVQQEVNVPVGVWTHLAGTYDGSTAKVYFDGELDGEMKFSTTIDVTDRVLMMGANVQNNVPFRNVPPFVGALDEAAIFNEALGADEIKQFMTGGLLAVQPAGKLSSAWGAIKYQ